MFCLEILGLSNISHNIQNGSQPKERNSLKLLPPYTKDVHLNVHNTFRKRPARLLKMLCALNLPLVSKGLLVFTMAITIVEVVSWQRRFESGPSHKICENKVFTDPHSPEYEQNLRFCLYTGECGSVETRILTYFMKLLSRSRTALSKFLSKNIQMTKCQTSKNKFQ